MEKRKKTPSLTRKGGNPLSRCKLSRTSGEHLPEKRTVGGGCVRAVTLLLSDFCWGGRKDRFQVVTSGQGGGYSKNGGSASGSHYNGGILGSDISPLGDPPLRRGEKGVEKGQNYKLGRAV